jgi:hypothetical protein
MKLPLIIRSHYYKGLLVLMRRDRSIDTRERDLMLQIGEVLDFDRRFCEAAIDDLLSNANITRDPVIFCDENIKECFFRDALRLALVDGNLHKMELRWLRKVAYSNGRTDQWLDSLIQEFQGKKNAQDGKVPFEIQRHLESAVSYQSQPTEGFRSYV